MENIIQNISEQFAAITKLEWFGVITGALCVYLAAKQNILNWPIAVLSIITYIYIFYDAKLYGDTALQFYFLATSIYGWYYWIYGKNDTLKSNRPISIVSKREWVYASIILVFCSIIIGFLLNNYTDTDVPFIDAFCTVTSFIAQYLLTRKKIENWLIWIFVDIIYIPLYIHKNLFATAALYFVFSLIAIKGFLDWKKSLKAQEVNG